MVPEGLAMPPNSNQDPQSGCRTFSNALETCEIMRLGASCRRSKALLHPTTITCTITLRETAQNRA